MNEFERVPDDVRRGLSRFEDEGREQGKPRVGLDFRSTWCPRHLEPWKKDWPKGAVEAMTKIFQAFSADERVLRLAGYDPDVEDSEADVMKLPAILAEHSPICCFLGDDVVNEIRREVLG